MAKMTRQNPQIFEQIAARLKDLDGKVAKAGWFPSSVYENGAPVAGIAAVQEFGAHINHPGGTPYKIGADGKAIFVSKANGAGLPVTKPHEIVIPPRPFMRPTAIREKQNWIAIMASGAKAILAGNATGYSVMEALGLRAAADIAKSISQVVVPPLKASTIAARRRRLSDTTHIGSLGKPLVDSGILLTTVSNTVEDA